MAFRCIIGQERALALIRRSLAKDRLPQAYLFTGPQGVGKRLAALALAKALNCQGPADGDSCGSCLSCRKIDKGLHPDVRIVEPEGAFIRIDQIRELTEDLSRRPYEGRRKVYILDQAERMGLEAANAFLKTLEEPPGTALLILVTPSPEALLPTVRSRCQEVKFNPLPIPAVVSYLERVAGLDPEEAWLLASLSGGSLERAMEVQAGSRLKNQEHHRLQVFSALASGGVALLDVAEELAKDKEVFREALEGLLIWYRDLVVYQHTTRGSLLWNRDRETEIRKGAETLAPKVGMKLYYAVNEALEALSGNVNPRLAAETLLFRMEEALSGPQG
ncbi:MAG: DNA polymerase III subunit delta' [candidate division NC10 bacterium]|nr:DNA polymerase III subunit delta' [candidate division NC10 bacterium]